MIIKPSKKRAVVHIYRCSPGLQDTPFEFGEASAQTKLTEVSSSPSKVYGWWNGRWCTRNLLIKMLFVSNLVCLHVCFHVVPSRLLTRQMLMTHERIAQFGRLPAWKTNPIYSCFARKAPHPRSLGYNPSGKQPHPSTYQGWSLTSFVYRSPCHRQPKGTWLIALGQCVDTDS